MNVRRVRALMGKEARELVRDPITLWLALLMPLVMLFLFGYAVSLDVAGVRIGVYDESRSPASRELAARFAATDAFATPRSSMTLSPRPFADSLIGSSGKSS